MTNSRIRRRKSVPSITQIDEQEALLPEELSQERMLDLQQEQQEARKPSPSNELREQGTGTIGDINQIRVELREETSYPVVEPEYWDDTHNWQGEYGAESQEYWHFVGRYE